MSKPAIINAFLAFLTLMLALTYSLLLPKYSFT